MLVIENIGILHKEHHKVVFIIIIQCKDIIIIHWNSNKFNKVIYNNNHNNYNHNKIMIKVNI